MILFPPCTIVNASIDFSENICPKKNPHIFMFRNINHNDRVHTVEIYDSIIKSGSCMYGITVRYSVEFSLYSATCQE